MMAPGMFARMTGQPQSHVVPLGQRPAIEQLRELLNYGHVHAKGVYDMTARTAIARLLISSVMQADIIAGEPLIIDKEDPEGNPWEYWSGLIVERGFGIVQDEDGHIVPWSIKANQARGDEVRKSRGSTWRKDPPGRFCGKIIKKGTKFFSCKTCTMEPPLNLCADCFLAGDHEGHELVYVHAYAFAEMCGCGTYTTHGRSATSQVGCAHHPALPPTKVGLDEVEPSAERYNTLYNTLSKGRGSPAQQHLFTLFQLLIDHICTVFEQTPMLSEWNKLPATREEFNRREVSHTIVARRNWGNGPWTVIIQDNDKHSFAEAGRQFQMARGETKSAADSFVKELSDLGRSASFTTNNLVAAYHDADMFQQVDMWVSLRHAFDAFREDMAAVIIAFLADLCDCHMDGDPDMIPMILAAAMEEPRPTHDRHLAPDVRFHRTGRTSDPPMRLDWLLLLDNRLWKKPKLDMRTIYARLFSVNAGVRDLLVDRFGRGFVRFAELHITEERDQDSSVAGSLLTNMVPLGHPLTLLSGQRKRRILDDPYDLTIDLIQVVQSWFTDGINQGALQIPVRDPQRLADFDHAKWESNVISRSRKGIDFLHTLRILACQEEVAWKSCSDDVFFGRLVDLLSCFVGYGAQAHQTKEHVKYEAEYHRAFMIMVEVAGLGRNVAETNLRFYRLGRLEEDKQLPIARMIKVMKRIHSLQTLHSKVLDAKKFPTPEMRLVTGVLLPSAQALPLLVPAWGMPGFSFHNQLHYLLAELFKPLFVIEHSRPVSARDIFRTAIIAHGTEIDTDNLILSTVNASLTTFMVMGQIRAGMWARNGQSMRNQLIAYRDISTREYALDQDFVLLQVALCSLKPMSAITSIIDRYGMNQAFREAGHTHLLFIDWAEFTTDISMIIELLEDMVWLIIHLVTDIDCLTVKSNTALCRKAIIQALAVSDLSWIDIHRRLPERIFGDVQYQDILNELATSRRPIEQGLVMFSLKPEYYVEVDPVWRHYTRNEKASVQANILSHLRKISPDDPKVFVKPLPLELPFFKSCKPHSALRAVLEGPAGQRLVHYLIGHCIQIGYGDLHTAEPLLPDASRCDQLLDASLWLATLIVDNYPIYFSKASVDPRFVSLEVQDTPTAFDETSTPNTLFENLEKLQVDGELWKDFTNRIDYIIDKIVQNSPCELVDAYLRRQELRQRSQVPADAGLPSTAAEKAAQRQKDLLAEFAKKQADFAALMFDADDDEDEGEDDEMEGESHANAMVVDVKPDDAESVYDNCIVCGDAIDSKRPGGLLAYFQPSRVLREWSLDKHLYERSMSTPCNFDEASVKLTDLDEPEEIGVTDAYSQNNNRLGAFVSFCGHTMHEDCLLRFFETTRVRHTTQVHRNQPENVMRMEYLCPLCKTISNHVVPCESSTTRMHPFKHRYVRDRPAPLMDHIRSVSQEHLRSNSDSGKIWEHHEDGGQLTPWYADTFINVESLDQQNRRTSMKSASRLIDRYRSLIRSLSEQSVAYRPNRGRKGMYLPEDVVGYTIACQEVALRGIGRTTDQNTVAEQMSSTSVLAVKQMVKQLQLELDIYFGPRYRRTTLRVALFCRFLPDYYRASTLQYPVLLRDPLTLAIEAAAIAPDLLHPVMVMGYLAEVTRVMISLSLFIRRSSGMWDNVHSMAMMLAPLDLDAFSPDALSVFAGIRPIMRQIIQNTGAYGAADENILRPISDEILSKLLYMCTLPILRRFAMLYHSLTGEYPVPTAPALDSTRGRSEYHRLLALLDLPRPTEVLGDHKSTLYPIVMRWVSLWVQHGRHISSLEWPGLYQLVRLPARMEDLVRFYEGKRCSECISVPTNPAICLFCGRLLCLGGDCCASGEQGECNTHLRECGATTGIFLDIRRWAVLLLFAGNGSFVAAPYVDAFGETDYRRTNSTRLNLNLKRLHDLRRGIWLNHTVPHAIARKLETTNDSGGWGTL